MDFEGLLRPCLTGAATSDGSFGVSGSCCVSSGVRRVGDRDLPCDSSQSGWFFQLSTAETFGCCGLGQLLRSASPTAISVLAV